MLNCLSILINILSIIMGVCMVLVGIALLINTLRTKIDNKCNYEIILKIGLVISSIGYILLGICIIFY